MTRILLTTAVALSLSGPALASDQLARSLDVEPGAYSTAELIALQAAIQDDEQAAANAIRRAAGAGFAVSTRTADVVDSAVIVSAEQEGNHAQARFLRAHGVAGENFTASTSNGVSAGHARLAAELGVNAADYSLADLVRMQSNLIADDSRD